VQPLVSLLRSLNAVRQPGVYVYCALPLEADISGLPALAMFREREALTVVLEESEALTRRLEPRFRAAWITLSVYSDLEAVGLTAAVARALADAGISCNVIAAVHHDHLFVPVAAADAALAALARLGKNVISDENTG